MNERQEPAAADFLDRLAAKARGEDSGLQPRLPSFFEPIRQVRMGMAAEAAPIGLLEEGADSAPRTARDDGLTRVQLATPTAEAQPHEAGAAHTRRPHEAVQSSATRPEPSHVVPATPAPAPSVVARPRGPIEALAARQDGLAPAPPPRSRDGLAPTLLRLSVADAVLAEAIGDTAPTRDGTRAPHARDEVRSTQSASPDSPAREPVRGGRRPVADEKGEATRADRPPATNGALVPAPEPGVRRVVVEALTTRRRSAPEQARVEAPAAAEATPVINVTIGRVEVRAVPTPPQRTEDRGPRPMSLEEYLKRRGGGR